MILAECCGAIISGGTRRHVKMSTCKAGYRATSTTTSSPDWAELCSLPAIGNVPIDFPKILTAVGGFSALYSGIDSSGMHCIRMPVSKSENSHSPILGSENSNLTPRNSGRMVVKDSDESGNHGYPHIEWCRRIACCASSFDVYRSATVLDDGIPATSVHNNSQAVLQSPELNSKMEDFSHRPTHHMGVWFWFVGSVVLLAFLSRRLLSRQKLEGEFLNERGERIKQITRDVRLWKFVHR